MQTDSRSLLSLAASGLIALALIPVGEALGGANFSQGFDNNGTVPPGADGPQNLINQGWIFRNQSLPVGSGTWHTGYNDWFPPQAGAGYLAVESTSTDFFGGDVSQWAILPVIPGQQAGDTFTFYVRRFDSDNVDTMQLRYSPSGGTSTGSGPDAVGDFTTLLVDLNPIPLTGWTVVSAAVPGTGRFAIRFYVNDACNFACFSSYVGIDQLTVNQSAPPGPPLPAPGQTVHWTTAISPVVLGSDTAIVAGGTVIVDPSVEVRVEGTATLYVLGVIRFDAGTRLDVSSTGNVRVEGLGEFLGTAAAPMTMTGGLGGAYAKGIEVASGGTARLDYVNSDLPVYVHPNSIYDEDTHTILIDHATFTGDGDVRSMFGTLAIRNTSFSGPAVYVQDSYLLLDAATLNGSVLQTARWKAGQPVYLDNLLAQNVGGDAPFLLHGYDYFFGPNNIISNNLYPVHLIGGGIAPGSTLPTAGNVNNYVHGGIGEFIGRVTFADAGLPYRIDFDSSAPVNLGELTLEPGVTVKLGPGAYIHSYVGGTVIAEGLPDAPITFERLDPAQPWRSISFRNSRRPKMEYCIARGADWAFGADETIVRLESCRLENNDIGASSYSFGATVARKCEFIGNNRGVRTSPGISGIGAGHADLDGLTNPNSFAGNSVAFEVLAPQNTEYAPNNWWNDPSGPTHSSNPGGTGEVVLGNAVVVPFRTSPPNMNDTPPRVRLEEHSFLFEEGQKVVLHWTAADDDGLTGFRILYSPHSENPPLSLLLDGILPSARSAEIVVPQAPPSSNNAASVLRVVAVDTAGQEGWDEIMFDTPYVDFSGGVVPLDIIGPLRPGQKVDLCYTVLPGSSGTVDAALFIDGDAQAFSLGGAHTGVTCLPLGLTAPPVSTDTARVGVRYNAGAGGRFRWEFTDYFAIRPDPALGDAPPTVQLLTPQPGQSFGGGSVVPITWTASDDEALRSFDLQASYDGGRTWHVVVKDLPGTATSYKWALPSSGGIPDVRVRVIARDLRFQNSSDASGAFAIAPGQGYPVGDLDCDGTVSFGDINPFILALSDPSGYAAAYPDCYIANGNINGDGSVDFGDINPFVALLAGG